MAFCLPHPLHTFKHLVFETRGSVLDALKNGCERHTPLVRLIYHTVMELSICLTGILITWLPHMQYRYMVQALRGAQARSTEQINYPDHTDD